MASAVLFFQSDITHFSSSFPFNKQLKLRNPVLSLTEIADKSTPFSSHRLTVSGLTSNGNRGGSSIRKSSASGRNKAKGDESKKSSDGIKAPNSSNQDEIIALFRRIQSSISKRKTASSKPKTSGSSKNKPAAESVSDVLNDSRKNEQDNRTKRGGKASRWKSGVPKKRKGLGKKAVAATQDFKSSRLPSNFVKRSPIPYPTFPRGKTIEKNNQVVAQDFKLSRLPSNFVKRSPIPYPTVPRGEVAQDFKLSRLPSHFVKRSPMPYPTVPRGKNPSNEEMKVANVEKLKLPELKELAKAKGIKGYSRLKKGELVQLLRS